MMLKIAPYSFLLIIPFLNAAEFSVQWDGGGADQNWETDLNWTTDTVPCNTGSDIFNAFIGGGAGAILINDSCTLESIEMQLGASFSLANNRSLTIRDYLDNSGTIHLNGSTGISSINISDSSGDDQVSFTGSGTILLDSDLDRIGGTFGQTLINDGGHIIRGTGRIAQGSVNVINNGSMIADSPSNTLIIDPLSTFQNSGFLIAENAGTLNLASGIYNNSFGTMRVADSSEILLQGATMNGGSFSVEDINGIISDNLVTVNGANRLNGFTNYAHINIPNNSTLTIGDGDFANNGLITPESIGSITSLSFGDSAGDQMIELSGTGTIVMDHANERVTGTFGHTLVHNAPHEIYGAGNIGTGSLNVINHSHIYSSNGGIPLIIDPLSTWVNDGGVVSALGGTLLQANSGTYSCINGGKFVIGDNGEIELSSFTGVTCLFEPDDIDLNPDNHLVTVTGTSTLKSSTNLCRLEVDNNNTLNLQENDFINDGAIYLNSTGSPCNLSISDSSDGIFGITGSGAIYLDNPALDRITGTNGHTFLQDTDHSIEGAGLIGLGSLNLINKGTIISNLSGQTLTIDPLNSFVNDGGTLRATNSAAIALNSGTYSSQNGGLYLIEDDTSFSVNTSTFTNMAFDVSDLDTDLTNNLLNITGTSTFNGVTNEAEIHLENNRTLNLVDQDFTNNGLIYLDSIGNNTSISLNGVGDAEFTITGTGTIFLDNTSRDLITTVFGHTFIHDTDHRIEGAGSIGLSAANIINRGQIEANLTGQTLNVDPLTSYINDGGSLLASNDSAIQFLAGTYSSTNGGTYTLEDGSNFISNGATFQDLSLDIIDLDIDLSNNVLNVINTSTFNGVTNHMQLRVGNNLTMNLLNQDFVNNGEIHLDSTGSNTTLSISGTGDSRLSLLGTGQLFLDGITDRVSGVFAHTLVNGPEHAMSGSGQIGLAAIYLENEGLITADRNGESLIVDIVGGSIQNSGIMEARSGGVLDLRDPINAGGGDFYTEAGALITSTSTMLQSGGTTTSDGEIQATSLTIASNSLLKGTGLVEANVNATDSAISPGNSTGNLNIEGNTVMGTGSSLLIEINATADHDLLAITSGNLNLAGGVLELNYGGGMTDVLNTDVLTIVTCTGTITGEFLNVADGAHLVSSDGLVSFQVNYGLNDITLSDFIYLGGAVNQAPIFTNSTTALSVSESTSTGTVLFDFDAYDPEGVVIEYPDSTPAPFTLDQATGELVLSSPLNFEAQDEWIINISAYDQLNYTNIVLTLTVLDAIDNNEEFVEQKLTAPAGPFPFETDPAIIGFDADSDLDGRGNVFELWMNTDPSVNDLPTPFILEPFDVSGSDHGSIIIEVSEEMDDLLHIVVEFSHNLNEWRECTNNRIVVSTSTPTRTLRFHDSIPISGDNKFFVRFTATELGEKPTP